jgi:hypothetical protein
MYIKKMCGRLLAETYCPIDERNHLRSGDRVVRKDGAVAVPFY